MPSIALEIGDGDVAAAGVLGLDHRAVGLETLLVRLRRPQRLGAGQEEVAREARLDGDDVADVAELLDALEQDHIHD